MSATLELFDGTNTINLLGTVFIARIDSGVGIPRPPNTPIISANRLAAIDFDPRTVTMRVRVKGTSLSDLQTQISTLERMMSLARTRQLIGESSTKVVLKYQLGDTNSRDASLTVISGGFSADPDSFNKTRVNTAFEINGTLTLICESFGKLADVPMGRKLLHNEIDGTNINYVDIGDGWGGFFNFDGSATVVNCGSDTSIDDIFDSGGYVRVRFRVDDLSASHVLVSKAWIIATSTSGQLSFENIFSGSNGAWNTTDAGLVIDEWYVLEFSYDADSSANNPEMKLTVGGVTSTLDVNRSFGPTGTRTSDAASSLLIGANSWMSGDISEVALYEASGITDSVFQGLDGNETNLVAYWSFEEGAGTTVRDNSSNTNDGTITPGAGGWGVDPTLGDAGALLQIRIEDEGSDAWDSNKVLYMATKSGERRTDTIFLSTPDSITELDSPDTSAGADLTFSSGTTGGLATNAHKGDSAFMRWDNPGVGQTFESDYIDTGYFQFNISTLPRGLYRVLVRVAVEFTWIAGTRPSADDVGDWGFSLGHVFGGKTKTPVDGDHVLLSTSMVEDEWNLLDLGEISISPLATPDGFTDPTLNLRIHTIWDPAGDVYETNNAGDDWRIYLDHIMLLPIDEGSVIVNSVSATDEVLADRISDPPGVWLLNTSSVPQKFADSNGAPIKLGPEATRLYWIKDDTDDPSQTIAYVYIKYTPLVSGLGI